MKIINTRIHGVLDYLVGALLVVAPWLFGFARGGAETWVPVVLGLAAVIYSLLTRYELGVIHAIPMNIHLLLDFFSGVLLLCSPWLFGFSQYVRSPHVIIGLLENGVALLTRPHPFEEHLPQTHAH